ncbi:transglutaminase domain-containing protein [Streptococcus ruminantium]|uniref:transglutaminase domain-containing protein n=1 Tax=Streptococcus ruminantium TaxID=1917441 RepID=UPI0012DF4577|nr:transglutaminase domain-containing protein [Streptococcus ruminantium]
MNYHQNADRQRRYAIRKMSVCVGSVLVGFFFLNGNTVTAHAAETDMVSSTISIQDIDVSNSGTKLSTDDESSVASNISSKLTSKEIESESTPTGAVPVSAVNNIGISKSENGISSEAQSTLIEEVPKISEGDVKETILKPVAHNYYEDEQYELSQRQVTVIEGRPVKLSLKKVGGEETVENVEWFIRTHYPKSEVYKAGESIKDESGSKDLLHLGADGTVTNLNQQDKTSHAELWARHNQRLYRAVVELPSSAESRGILQEEEAHREAEKIVKNFEGLSDVEKAKAAHDWLVNNVDYVEREALKDQTAYSALIEKKTVCAGYAKAFKLLMDKMGILTHTQFGTIIGARAGSENHLWNVINLGGEWYHVDATWDDPRYTLGGGRYRVSNENNEHFLIHDEDFELTSNTKRHYLKTRRDNMGERYRYYGFEERGIVARSIDEAKIILERQYHKAAIEKSSVDSGSVEKGFMTLELMAPNKVSRHNIENKLAEVVGHGHFETISSNYGGYQLHRFRLKLFAEDVKERQILVSDVRLKAVDSDNKKISSIEVELGREVELNEANFTLTGARLARVEKLAGTKYKLLLDEPQRMTDAKVKVAINKRAYQFTLINSEVPIDVKRAEMPKATFIATGETTGYLSNVKPGMEYLIDQLDQIKWVSITGDRVELENIGPRNVYVRVKETETAFASPLQRIEIKKADDPRGVKVHSNQIVGVNKDMEYRRKGDTVWFWSSGNILKGLVNGEYEIRTRATGDHLASNIEVVNLTGGLQATQENIAKQQARAEQEAAARQTEAKRQVEAEKAKVQEQSKTEQDAKRKAEEKAAVEKAKAEQDAKRKAEEKAAVEKAKAEQEAKRKAEEKAAVEKAKAEQEAKRKAEEKAAVEKAKAEQEAKRKAEEKAAVEKAKAEQEAKRKAEEKAAIEKAKAEQEAKRKAAKTQNKEQEMARQVETNSQSEAQPQSQVASGVTTVQHQESTSQRSAVSQGQTGAQRAATTTHQAPAQSLTTEQTQNNPVTPKASEGEKANVEKKSEDKKATSKEQVASAQEVKKATEKKQHLVLPLVLALSAIILGLFGYSKMQNKKED